MSNLDEVYVSGTYMFPSPHSGILFLFRDLLADCHFHKLVSFPSFGDSFFMTACIH